VFFFWGKCYILEEREMHTRFWMGNLKARDHFEKLEVHERIALT